MYLSSWLPVGAGATVSPVCLLAGSGRGGAVERLTGAVRCVAEQAAVTVSTECEEVSDSESPSYNRPRPCSKSMAQSSC